MSNFATQKMQSFVSVVSSENYDQFFARDPTKYHVLLFTERKTTAPLFKALSKKFKDKLLFGEVRKSEADLIQKFGIVQTPGILVVTDPQEFKGDLFQEEIKIDQITKFLNTYSYKTLEKKTELQHLTYKKFKVNGLCAKK